MKKATYIFSILLLTACTTVPLTGRKQMKIISSSELNTMAFQQYGEFLSTNKLSSNKRDAASVKKVGNKIRVAVEKYLKSINRLDIINGFKWEFNLVEDKSINAWAMPGGKVVFYSGIIPICKNEAGIAVVMGHEIAHIIAGHGNERMSQEMIAQLGISALSQALKEKPKKTKNLLLTAVGMGAQYGVLLPFSRTHEKEADRIGLIIMTMAGYDPHEAPTFWKRMSKLSNGKEPPEFLSTHPSSSNRIADLQAAIPEAMKYKK
jgi:predicted Zn-dependent protease